MNFLELIEHPEHVLRICHDIRSRHVEVRAYVARDLAHPAAAELLDFVQAEIVWVTHNALFGSAERYVHNGTLPGHPHRERPDRVNGFERVEPDTALAWAARIVVLNPEPAKIWIPPRSILIGNTEMIFPHRIAQQIPRGPVEAQQPAILSNCSCAVANGLYDFSGTVLFLRPGWPGFFVVIGYALHV